MDIIIISPPESVQILGISEKIKKPAKLAKIILMYSIGETMVVSANFRALIEQFTLNEPNIANKNNNKNSFILGVSQNKKHNGIINNVEKKPW